MREIRNTWMDDHTRWMNAEKVRQYGCSSPALKRELNSELNRCDGVRFPPVSFMCLATGTSFGLHPAPDLQCCTACNVGTQSCTACVFMDRKLHASLGDGENVDEHQERREISKQVTDIAAN